MLSEDFDKKMREAADRHHPQYDERAWREMKKLLDQHMPVEEDRKRRGLFFLLFLLLLGGGAAVYFFGFSGGRKEQVASTVQPVSAQGQPAAVEPASASANHPMDNQQVEKPAAAAAPTAVSADAKPLSDKASSPATVANSTTYDVSSTKSQRDLATVTTGQINTNGSGKKNRNVRQTQPDLSNTNGSVIAPAEKKKTNRSDNNQPTVTTGGSKSPEKEPASLPAVTAATTPVATTPASTPVGQGRDNAIERADPPSDLNHPAAGNSNDKTPATPPVTAKTETKTNPIKQVSKKKSSFFIAASAAPDVSFTSGDELGRMKLTGGIGLGYTYRGRLTLRTGFYSARKIYTASPDSYKRTAWFNQYYPNLQKVEADCKVQEIPILLSYHFGQQRNHQWFASAGVSTLIMKEETYDYYYKYTAWGQVVNRSHTTYNQNKHPFSIMTLSAGYQYKLGKRFSVIAEPYLKLPLSGVGNGKVKLNSMGMMFSVTASPFGK